MTTNRRTKIAILLSVILHMMIGAVLWFKPDLFSKFATTPKSKMQMEFVDADKLLKDLKSVPQEPLGQIVDQSEQALNDDIPVDSKYLSRHNQTVVRETQASLHGKFKNTDQSAGVAKREVKIGKVAAMDPNQAPPKPVPPTAAKPNPANPKEQAKSSPEEKSKESKTAKADAESQSEDLADSKLNPDLSDKLQDANGGTVVRSGARPKFRDLVPSFIPAPPIEAESNQIAEGGGTGASSTDDHLKDVAVGSQTILSTREFVYFSYYNRIKDKLRQYWEPKIKEKITHILRAGRHIASNSDHTTRIVIVLDRRGDLQHVQVMSGSGVEDLDDAAVEAFRAAAPFPNPPKGIIESDGTVKINWDFVIEA